MPASAIRALPALARRVDGVSQKILAQALHALEREGFIDRDVQTNRLHVEYSLTGWAVRSRPRSGSC